MSNQGDILLMYERNRNASRDVIDDDEVDRGVDGVTGEAHVLVDAIGETMSLIALGEIAVALTENCSSSTEGVAMEASACGIVGTSSSGFRGSE